MAKLCVLVAALRVRSDSFMAPVVYPAGNIAYYCQDMYVCQLTTLPLLAACSQLGLVANLSAMTVGSMRLLLHIL
jgi:hypothetical protein